MLATVVQCKNSREMSLPAAFLCEWRLKEGDTIDVRFENGKIAIKKSIMPVHRSTKERIADFFLENPDDDITPLTTIDWGKPVGNEIW